MIKKEDYIVWYVNKKTNCSFSKEFTFDELLEQKHIDEICDSTLLKDFEVKEINRGIGITDINNKKIYADSSIVEFEILDDNGLQMFRKKEVGLFEYHNEGCQYLIKELNSNIRHSLAVDMIENIKIIDTIQENKLGLIK